jgi:Fe2+ transport system protein B
MELSEIASINGKGGLFKVLKPTKAGVILESLDEAKTKLVASATQKLSLLKEISIYTTTKKGTASLEEVLQKIHQDFGNDIGLSSEADAAELKSFLKSVLPEYDENRVYVSDIKKLVKWYQIILQQAPEILTAPIASQEAEADETVKA